LNKKTAYLFLINRRYPEKEKISLEKKENSTVLCGTICKMKNISNFYYNTNKRYSINKQESRLKSLYKWVSS
jgi:hypothetical protein